MFLCFPKICWTFSWSVLNTHFKHSGSFLLHTAWFSSCCQISSYQDGIKSWILQLCLHHQKWTRTYPVCPQTVRTRNQYPAQEMEVPLKMKKSQMMRNWGENLYPFNQASLLFHDLWRYLCVFPQWFQYIFINKPTEAYFEWYEQIIPQNT